jgi:predicted secreted protein
MSSAGPIAKVLSLCLVVTMCFCSLAEPRTLVLTEQDADNKQMLRIGDSVIIKLDVLPANGYLWFVSDYRPGLTELNQTHFEPAQREGVPGGHEVQVFNLLAVKKGLQKLIGDS